MVPADVAGLFRATYGSYANPSPRPSSSASGPGLKISAIAWSADQPLALINGRIVKPGDTVDSAEITGITRTDVTLKRGGETVTLSLNPLLTQGTKQP
jgi:hypothetical protein